MACSFKNLKPLLYGIAFFCFISLTAKATPTISLTHNGSIVTFVGLGYVYKDSGWVAKDSANNDYSQFITYTGTVDIFNIGDYHLSYYIPANIGNCQPHTVIVTVADTVPPVLTLVGPDSMTILKFSGYVEPWIKVHDNYWPLANILVVKKGELRTDSGGYYTFTYIAIDGSGNVDSLHRVIRVLAHHKFYLVLNGDSQMQIKAHTPFMEPGCIARDSDNNDYSALVTRKGVIDTSISWRELFLLTYELKGLDSVEAIPAHRWVLVGDFQSVDNINDPSSFNVYPNPSSGKITIEKNKGSGQLKEIYIYDIAGKQVFNKGFDQPDQNEMELNVEYLQLGLYLLQVSTDGGIYRKKIQIIK